MTRNVSSAMSLVSVAALLAALAGASGCKLSAGVDSTPGTAGSSGAAGAGGMSMPNDAAMSTGAAGSPFDFGGKYADAGATDSSVPAGPCTNLACQQSTCRRGNCTVTCPAGKRTTVSGTIFDPAGNVPLYNITVFAPNAALDDIKDGPSCDPCDPMTGTSLLSGQPVAVTKTDTAGKFTLGASNTGGDVPAGTNIPMVIQVGKWRRPITVPNVVACQDNPITDMTMLHLPRSSAEGHIPKMALTTGQSDAMECLLRKIGIADTEFSTEAGTGRVNFYAGGGGTSAFATTVGGGLPFTPANPWWDSLDNLKKYDIVLHSCEGGQGSYGPDGMGGVTEPMSVKSMAARQALNDFVDIGGRVFASHWHAYWFENGTDKFKMVGTFNHRMPGLANPYDSTIDQSFPTGSALAQWMMGPQVQGSTTLGMVSIAQDASNRIIDAAAGAPISQRWLYASTLTPQSVQFLSATTPIPGGTCGRAVLSDLHVSAGGKGSDMPNTPFPTGCVTTTLSPREKVLEFMLFDIASCVQPIVQ